jgi:hypothetical protein
MLITKEQIEVTEQMMFKNGLSKYFGNELGVPFSATQKQPITWKGAFDLEESDYDMIESYFMNLQKSANNV